MEPMREHGLVPNKPLQQMMISGRCIVILDPHVDQIDISDTAYALARTARYAGNTKGEPYSVAQHSVEVSCEIQRLYPNDILLQLAGLLHDAGEAPLIDVPYPVKRAVTGFSELEAPILRCYERKFMIPNGMCDDKRVKSADWTTHQREVRDILPEPNVLSKFEYWGYDPETIEGPVIVPKHWAHAKNSFLKRFNELWDTAETLRSCAV